MYLNDEKQSHSELHQFNDVYVLDNFRPVVGAIACCLGREGLVNELDFEAVALRFGWKLTSKSVKEP